MEVNRLRPRVCPAVWISTLALAVAFGAAAQPGLAQRDSSVTVVGNDSVSFRLVDVDLRSAIQVFARHMAKPVLFGQLSGARVTLETPQPVPRSDLPSLLRGLLEAQDLKLVEDSTYFHVVAKEQPQPAAQSAEQQAAMTGGARGGPLQFYVIRLQHARAADVAATVNALYGRASALGELGARPTRTLSDQLRYSQQIPPMGEPVQAPVPIAPESSTPPPTGSRRQAELTGETTIVPDAGTNSLLIRANAQDYQLIKTAVEQLDVRPLQVLIEVLIAEVRKDRQLSFGVGASLQATKVSPGDGNTTVEGGTTGLGLGDFVVKVMNLGGVDLDATLSAAASRGDVTIMSRPVVIAANNESASILVGSQRPFIQVVRALPTENAVRDQVIQYRDVGTRLTVRPTISSDGYVTLDVSQEVNAATSETAFDAPVISTRELQTELLIKDGQTVVLGGLTDHQRDHTQGGVPILSSIPLLGGLFGHVTRQTSDTELLLFLTPHVIRSDAEADAITQPLRERARKVAP
ncbi:MAG TPA: secretin N-terminal domain-containing protein [Gemmatimonadaceae bacterium]|nr:secretin N-terminal domain-containing protein [Gemmatimonadaceae bacterium]